VVDHTIEAHFVVSSKDEASIISALAKAMAGERPSFREKTAADALAPMLYRAFKHMKLAK